jgi:hypothetical protein
MAYPSRCAPAREIDWDAARRFAEEEIIQVLRSSEEFAAAANLHEQYFQAYDLLHVRHRPAVPLSLIGRLFNVSKATIRWHYRHFLDQQAQHHLNGRPSLLTLDEHEDLVQQIMDGCHALHPWTMVEIVRHIADRYGKTLDPNTVCHLLHREPRLRTCRGIPMEERRLQGAREDVEAYFGRLDEALQKCASAFRLQYG